MLRQAGALVARRGKAAIDVAKTATRGLADAPAAKDLKLPTQHSIAGRYAAALYMAAAKADKLGAVEEELSQVAQMVNESRDFAEFIKDPSVPSVTKVEGLNSILEKMSASDITKNFVALLSDNNRLTELGHILGAFTDISAEQRGEVKALVTTAEELAREEVDELANGLADLLKPGQTLVLEEKVDPSIIGGIVIDINDKHVDLSILSRVKKLQQIIREAV